MAEQEKNGELSGTEGQSKRIEAVRINLTGEMEKIMMYITVYLHRIMAC